MQIIDNFLPDPDYKNIHKVITGAEFPWYYQDHKVEEGDNFSQFSHLLWDPQRGIASSFYPVVGSLLNALEIGILFRVKLNLTLRTESPKVSSMHYDNHCKDAITAIFYINTNNGYTLFEDGSKVDSVANRLVMFNSLTKHAGVSNTIEDSEDRWVLNVNFFTKSFIEF